MSSKFASKVVFTDGAPEVTPLAVENAVANGAVVDSDSVLETERCIVSGEQLRWGVDEAAVLAKHGKFDIVVASEVLYFHWVGACCVHTVCLFRVLSMRVASVTGRSHANG